MQGGRAWARCYLMRDFTNSRRVIRAKDTMPNDPKAPDPSVNALYTAITPGYFDALGSSFCAAAISRRPNARTRMHAASPSLMKKWRRNFSRTRTRSASMFAILSRRRMARLTILEIIGVVSKHRHDDPKRLHYSPIVCAAGPGLQRPDLFSRSTQTEDRQAVVAIIPTLRQSLREIDPDLPLLQMTPFVDLMEKSPNLWIVKLGAVLFGVFGCIALLLAVVGVYGVKAYAVACRTREIGIRMALGAHRKDVFALIMRQGAMQTALAVTVGHSAFTGRGPRPGANLV